MTKPGRKQLKQTFQQGSEHGHWKAVREMLRRHTTHFPEGVSAKMILMELSEISARFPHLRPLEACGYAAVLNSTHRDAAAPCPSPARTRESSQEECIEENIPPKPPVKSAAKKRGPSAALVDQEIASGIVAHLNDKAETNYRLTGQSARQLISARLGEGYTVDDIKAVIDKKAAEWKGTSMAQYLRPATLFGKEKFEQYHGQKAGQRSFSLGREQEMEHIRETNDWLKPLGK